MKTAPSFPQLIVGLTLVILCAAPSPGSAEIFHAMGEMAGEVSENSVILQSRLTSSRGLVSGDVPGAPGIARFEISQRADFRDARPTDWLPAIPANDYIVKVKVRGLEPATRYYYRLWYGASEQDVEAGEPGSFRTLQGAQGEAPVSFVVVTGMNYMSFHYGKVQNGRRTGRQQYEGEDKHLGFPALASMLALKPDFFVGTGDNVYYDSHDDQEATDLTGMRRKWHEQLVQPRFVELFRRVPTYWEKDDHDHRFNDCDREGNRPPLSDLGIRTFREQVPVVDPNDPSSKTYRTYRVSRHLQIWLVEGRDYRSPNKMPDGPDKTLWGAEQIRWLKETLLESDATWKVLISPTPLVGPDDAYKIDNHTNHRGFRTEGRQFFQWIKEQQLDQRGFLTICGDRHWQYHSVDPTGIEEFSCGALVDSNSRIGRSPGDKDSTDPDAEIRQLYTQQEASGGFLKVAITGDGAAEFSFFDENSKLLYQTTKRPEDRLSVLGDEAPQLLQQHLLTKVHAQYEARRADVRSAIRSRDSLIARQSSLRRRLKDILGELPPKTPLQPRVTGVIECDSYRIEKVVYQSRPRHFVTANLYVPTHSDGPFPGILIACGHSSLGKAYDTYQRAAILMALNGMVALVYDPIGQGERRSYLSGSGNAGLQHRLDNVGAVLVGRTAVGYQAWDGVRSLDYLLTRPEVRTDIPVGMTGNSGGGAQTMYLMALDDRIGPAAPSCHITTLERNFDLGAAGDGCQSPPRTGAVGIDHPDFFTIRAPKPSIILSAERDYKDIRFTRQTLGECRQVFATLGAADRIDMFAADDKHAFSQPRRQAATQWMRRWLLNELGPVSEPELTVQDPADLQVTKSGQVLTEYADALSVANLNLHRARELTVTRQTLWQQRSPNAAPAVIRELLGIAAVIAAPVTETHGAVDRDGYRVEKLILRRPGELPIPALLFSSSEAPDSQAITILVDGRGKAHEARPGGRIPSLIEKGQQVLSADLRGFGETAQPPSDVIYAAGDHRASMFSMHIGKTLLAQRVEELLAVLEFARTLSAVEQDSVHLVGIERAGPIALHAAVLDPRTSVETELSIASWIDDVLQDAQDLSHISHTVPGVLHHYDLTDLVTFVGERFAVGKPR